MDGTFFNLFFPAFLLIDCQHGFILWPRI